VRLPQTLADRHAHARRAARRKTLLGLNMVKYLRSIDFVVGNRRVGRAAF
jgi:hypothetical protein